MFPPRLSQYPAGRFGAQPLGVGVVPLGVGGGGVGLEERKKNVFRISWFVYSGLKITFNQFQLSCFLNCENK